MKIIVGVLANDEDGYDKMVQAAKDTCYKDIPEEFEVFYLYGRRSGVNIPKDYYKLDGNDFYYDFMEARRFLLIKTVAFFEYCYYNEDFDYIFRPNCGSYISLPLLRDFILEKQLPKEDLYFGSAHGSPPPYYVSGSGILLSKNLIQSIVENKESLIYDGDVHVNMDGKQVPMIDDISIGTFLYESLGIVPTPGALLEFVNLETLLNDNSFVDGKCYHYHFQATREPKCFYEVHNRLRDLGIVQ
jgi:hypothetical protein